MIELVHGRGQLGGCLKSKIAKYPELDCVLYHTWNFLEKTEIVQRGEHIKFKKFVDAHKNGKIVFISSLSKIDTPYLKYKRLAEDYLLKNNPDGKVIRLPTLLGKGICERFKKNEAVPYDEIELMTINDATDKVLSCISNSNNKIDVIHGQVISAKLVYELIKFGKK